ncbi:MAG: anaerobic ribonucleoside-triphosphate reductase activating protein, partial [Reyranella sp.]|nr:anaerobic ribonucleoside-triphosphate reductase activating protein [Reyranella sp.]
LAASGVAFEVRTTVHPALLDDAALSRLRDDLAGLGLRDHKIQAFRAAGCRDAILAASAQ